MSESQLRRGCWTLRRSRRRASVPIDCCALSRIKSDIRVWILIGKIMESISVWQLAVFVAVALAAVLLAFAAGLNVGANKHPPVTFDPKVSFAQLKEGDTIIMSFAAGLTRKQLNAYTRSIGQFLESRPGIKIFMKPSIEGDWSVTVLHEVLTLDESDKST
jgi:hypothetical protein